ncbi:MAG TPA: haloacid dehalogenase-like hydrolase [Polyangiaceae bacterium]
MAQPTDQITGLDAVGVIERLASMHRGQGAVVAFDADGTLWSGDVSEDVFEAALDADRFREEALEALRKAAAAHGLSERGTATEVARALYTAYHQGAFPESAVVEMMTWCYAGWSVSELRRFTEQVLAERKLEQRLCRKLEPILEYARNSGLRTVVISASPKGIVERAAALWSFAPPDIAAAETVTVAGRIQARLLHPVPYADAKPAAARRLFDGAEWLASFGDNVFDVPMFEAARLGVAVEPKLSLRQKLPELKNVVLLK